MDAAVSWAFPPALKAREDEQIACRREAVRLLEEKAEALAQQQPDSGHAPVANGTPAGGSSYSKDDAAVRVGFALSGGGKIGRAHV